MPDDGRMTSTAPNLIRNRTFDEIAVGDSESIRRTLTAEDIQLFAVLSGDTNPQHLDAEFAATTRHHGVIAHGMWGGARRHFDPDGERVAHVHRLAELQRLAQVHAAGAGQRVP
ncbi:MAG: hypothetical protein EOO24_57000, partial [Comamonadaceae bacterium]